MTTNAPRNANASNENLRVISHIRNDVEPPPDSTCSFTSWQFDALSDDGRDGVVIIFYDNFPFSSRYNENCLTTKPRYARFPATVFAYYQDGKLLFRAVKEFAEESLTVDRTIPSCRIGMSAFTFDSASYGSGYRVEIGGVLSGNRTVEARFEWLCMESDLATENDDSGKCDLTWNIVAPRCDVTGSVNITDSSGRVLGARHFRGTGFHQQTTCSFWPPSRFTAWQFGRAHFHDSTVMYLRLVGPDSREINKLAIVRNGVISIYDANYSETRIRPDVFLKSQAREFAFQTAEGVTLSLKHKKTLIRSSFHTRFISAAKLRIPNEGESEAYSLSQHISPARFKYRLLNRLTNFRVARSARI